jgi:penicillin amidase
MSDELFAELYAKAEASIPKIEGELVIKGLTESVEVIRDQWGIPHIYSKNDKDLFFAQGYVTAQDRLWQMELLRRTASGRLSEIFGEVVISSDIFYRNFGVKRAAETQMSLFLTKEIEEMKTKINAYLKGINQFITDNYSLLPIEFEILQFKPEKFTVKDIFLIYFLISSGLAMNWPSELLRLNLVEKFNDERAAILHPIESFLSFSSYTGMNFLSPTEAVKGSNNWVISGKKSTTGKPILANDPHLMITLPAFWYEIHLCSPEVNVVGASVAGIPGVIIVKGKERPLVKEFRWSRHGPLLEIFPMGSGKIVYSEIKKEYGLALKYIQNVEDFSRTFSVTLLINKAKSWLDFEEALKLMKIPSQNIVYADKSGNIGYYMSGIVPIRKKGEGIVPVPGWNDEYEWIDYIPFEEMPHCLNPENQFLATANNKVIPPQYPYLITHDFWLPDRVERIKKLLTKKIKLSLDDFREIQLDTYSARAEQVCKWLTSIEPNTEEQKEAISILNGWNFHLEEESAAALIYQVWVRKFFTLVFKPKLGEDLFTEFMSIAQDTLYYFNNPSEWLFQGTSNSIEENRDALLQKALTQALTELKKKFGPDMNQWRWGKVHLLTFRHPLSSAHPALEILNRGHFEVPGGNDTVNALWRYALDGYDCYGGVSYRQIIDLDDFSNSIAIFAPGQSGHPLSDHYADLIELFLEGKYHPMLFYRADVEKEKKHILSLKPETGK